MLLAIIRAILLSSLILALPSAVADATLQTRDILSVCTEIGNAITAASALYYPFDHYYDEDIEHYFSTSTQIAACSVEPGTAEDVGVILQILGQTQTPFAGGGHASNPGFSSTTGVQIAMARFNGVTYNADTGTADVGAGLIWDDVYAALEPYSMTVVGGRVTGIGVAGFTLGGGYSYLTNQHGLALDSVKAFKLVLPNSSITTVTASSNPELFFALRGGFNNFGIVTQFTLQTYPQSEVWGGVIETLGELDAIAAATADFYARITDPKAAIISTFNYDCSVGVSIGTMMLFYDGPTPPAGMFDEFLAIPALDQNVSTRSYLSLILAAPSNGTAGLQGYYDGVSLLDITPSILSAIVNETQFWSALCPAVPGLFISYAVEPFLPDAFLHGADSAWPPNRAEALLQINIYYAWNLNTSSSLVNEVMLHTASYLTQVAESEGQNLTNAALYPNYAIYDTPVYSIYGNNLPVLQAIKAQYDPDNVMSLTGGWKL